VGESRASLDRGAKVSFFKHRVRPSTLRRDVGGGVTIEQVSDMGKNVLHASAWEG